MGAYTSVLYTMHQEHLTLYHGPCGSEGGVFLNAVSAAAQLRSQQHAYISDQTLMTQCMCLSHPLGGCAYVALQ